MNRITLFILFVLISNLSIAQSVYHKLFNVQNGLSQSAVFCLHQDSEKQLWIGTSGGGINIYNGKDFDYLSTDDSLISNTIFSITSDSNNRKWIGTDKGLSIIDKKKITNYTTDNGLIENKIWSIAHDKNGMTWLGTDKGITTCYNLQFKKFDKDSLLSKSQVFTVFADSKNRLWFGTIKNGLFLYENNKIKQFTLADSLTHMNIRTISEDQNGTIWIGTDNGMVKYKNGKIIIYDPGKTYTSVISNNNQVFYITYTSLLFSQNINGNNKTPEMQIHFEKFRTRTMLIDHENSIWLGTETGLIQIPFTHFRNINNRVSVKTKLEDNNVYAISNGVIQSEYWFGTTSKGAASGKISSYSSDFKHFSTGDRLLISSSVYALFKDKKNQIWIGTPIGITIFNATDSSYTHISNEEKINSLPDKDKKYKHKIEFIITDKLPSPAIFSFIDDFKGNIWIGTTNGVAKYTDTGFVNMNEYIPELNGKYVRCIYQDKSGLIWFATQNGLITWNEKKSTLYNDKNGFAEVLVNSIDQDKYGNIWIATKEGLYIYNGYEFLKIDKSKGLLSSNMLSLKYDGNQYVYVGTDKGLERIDVSAWKQLNEIQIKHYTLTEGFLGVDCNLNALLIDSIGQVFTGTADGVTILNPRNEVKNTVIPITRLVKIKLNYEDFDFSPYCDYIDSLTGLPVNLKLPYNLNRLSFEFQSSSFKIPEKVLFRYKLEGVDADWSPAFNKNEADYPSLQPGKYTFQAISCNNDGVWSDTPVTFSFEILPPFYLTWWFITLVIVFIIAVIFISIIYREANLRKEKRILEEKVQERTLEIAQQKEIVEQKNKDITDSINYAKNIQEALLPANKEIKQIFPDNFVIFMPRDIVSGDFYWITTRENKTYFAVADCTGHGVPGAFMSLLGIAFLDEIIAIDPNVSAAELLNKLRANVIDSLKGTEAKDGMDITLVVVDWKERKLEITGANNPLYFIRNNSLKEYKSQKMPIGSHPEPVPFQSQTVDLWAGDTIFMFSDGFADQFGGPDGKKFKYKTLRDLLTGINYLPMSQQKEKIMEVWKSWTANHEQIDDVILIGIRFSEQTFENKTLT